MRALVEASRERDYPAKVALVISNKNEARGLAFAQDAGILTCVIDNRAYETREAFEATLDEQLREHNIEFICLAGFMRLLSPAFVEGWRGKIINIHPSLLPAFKGTHVHEQVLKAGVRVTGCTVHFVSAQMDEGPIIAQAAVPVDFQDTPETLESRVLEQEHRLYPHVVRLIAEGRVRVNGTQVIVENAGLPQGSLISPPLETRVRPRN